MASFQAKICWGRPRKRENNKKIVPTSSYPICNRKLKKIAKNSKKN